MAQDLYVKSMMKKMQAENWKRSWYWIMWDGQGRESLLNKLT